MVDGKSVNSSGSSWGRDLPRGAGGTEQHNGEGVPKSPGPGYFYLMCLSEKVSNGIRNHIFWH